MSHCPGLRLEDWITDWWRLVDVDGEYGTAIRRMYVGQLILSKEQFQGLLAIYEPARELVERVLQGYSEEENGSWRDFCGYAFDGIPKEIEDRAQEYVNTFQPQVEKTPGWMGSKDTK
jgi:hypothetical protein